MDMSPSGLALAWSTMMAAMMLPAALPSTVAHLRFGRRPLASAAYLAGYLGTWAAAGLAYAAANVALMHTPLLPDGMRLARPPVAGALLVAAGAWQWLPAKARCVGHCRSPMGFLLAEWRDGAAGAAWMGLRYARFCAGCCWLLMALLFVVVTMSLRWATALAAYALAERLLPVGRGFDRAVGAALAAWGLVLAFG